MLTIGQWLCNHNRHRLTWEPEQPRDAKVITGTGIPDHSFMIEKSPQSEYPSSVLVVTNAASHFLVVTQHPICKRCWVDLDQAFRHPLGWEEPHVKPITDHDLDRAWLWGWLTGALFAAALVLIALWYL